MKLDLFAERRRRNPDSDGRGDANPGKQHEDHQSEKQERRSASEEEPHQSWGDRLKHFAEALNQPIGQSSKDGAKDASKGKTKGKEPSRPKRPAAEKPKSWAEEMGMVVPDKPIDPKARQQADDAIAQGTYHLKRGNRETNVEKKIQCFETALEHFRTLQSLVPTDPNVGKQVEMVERGLNELRAAFERYRVSNPEAFEK